MIDFVQFAKVAMDLMEGSSHHDSTPRLGLRKVTFQNNGIPYVAIEQNPATGSKWARLANQGHDVVQFKQGEKYVAVAVDGNVQPY
jgi:hypothetical protein